MNRFRALAVFVLLAAFAFPAAASAADMPLLSPGWHIVPDAHELDPSCPVGSPLGFGGVLQLIQNLMNAGISIGIIICVMTIAFAGVLWMLTATNPENHSQAKKVLTNAAVGLLIILSAWLIVDFVMKVLYQGANGDPGKFGPWNSILVGGSVCVVASDDLKPLFSGSIFAKPGEGTETGAEPSAVQIGNASVGAAGCSPATITSAAAAGGYTLTQQQANTFSCIAKAESSCGTNISGATTVDGKPTTAHGMFQVVMGYKDDCHSLNIPVCTQAAKRAGWPGSGDLNCSTAFSGGKPKAGMTQLANACKAAAANVECNASAAACLLKNNPGFKDWTADSRSSAQKACVARYAK